MSARSTLCQRAQAITHKIRERWATYRQYQVSRRQLRHLSRPRLLVEELEPRLLLSGNPLPIDDTDLVMRLDFEQTVGTVATDTSPYGTSNDGTLTDGASFAIPAEVGRAIDSMMLLNPISALLDEAADDGVDDLGSGHVASFIFVNRGIGPR